MANGVFHVFCLLALSVYPDKFSLWIQWILWIRRAREEPNVFTRLNVTLSPGHLPNIRSCRKTAAQRKKLWKS